MADAEVQVVVRGQGFAELTMQAEAATAALKQMGNAARGATATNATEDAKKLEAFAAAARKAGADIGSTMGASIRTSVAAELSKDGTWSGAFRSLQGRFRTFGQTLGREMSVGITNAVNNIRNMNGPGRGPTHTDYIGGAAIGWGVYEMIAHSAKAGAEREGAEFRLRTLGTLDDGKAGGPQQKTVLDFADAMSKKYKNISGIDSVNFMRDALQIFGGPEHLFTDDGKGSQFTAQGRAGMERLFGLMSYARTYQAASGKEGDIGAIAMQFASAIRSGEIKGLGSNPEDLASWVDKLVHIQQATGVDPTKFLQAQQNAGVSFLTMDDDAIYGFAANVQEQKQRAGVMRRTGFMHMIAGNNQSWRSNEMMKELGLFGDEANFNRLVNEGKIEISKQGHITHYDPSIVPGYYDMGKNPYKWDAEVLYPLLRNKILADTGEDIGDVTKNPSQRSKEDMINLLRNVGATFRNPNEANEVAESIIQYTQMQRRGQNAKKAVVDVDGANALLLKRMQDFSGRWSDLAANVGKDVLPNVNALLGHVNDFVQKLSDLAKAHPNTTADVVTYGGGAMVGFGVLGAIGLLKSFARFPFKLIQSSILAVAGVTRGLMLGSGATDALAAASLAKTSSSLSKLLGRIPLIGGILSKLGGVMRGLGTLWALDEAWNLSNTDLGKDFWHSIGTGLRADYHNIMGRGNTGEKNKAIYDKWRFNKDFAEYWGIPDWLVKIPKEAPVNRYGPWRPGDVGGPSPYQSPLIGTNLSPGRGANFSPRGGGPVPVVVQSMPRGQDRPNNITINNNINVQSNASAASIAGAVGPATSSAAQSALHDIHH